MSNDSRAAAGQRESLKIVLCDYCSACRVGETDDHVISDYGKRCEKYELVWSIVFLTKINCLGFFEFYKCVKLIK